MWILRAAKRLIRSAGTLCFPPHCAACLADTEPGEHLCDPCLESAQRIEAPRCERCSWPFDGAITEAFVCADCHGREVHYDCAVAVYRSRGVVRDLIHRLKYDKKRHLAVPLSDWLAEALGDPRIAGKRPDAFIPVPLHPRRKREREFNQAEELCRILSKRSGIPTWRALKRVRYTETQTRLTREERMENLRGAFRAVQTVRLKGRDLVLVDDVFTTGSTVEECCRVLRRAGAASARVITVARG